MCLVSEAFDRFRRRSFQNWDSLAFFSDHCCPRSVRDKQSDNIVRAMDLLLCFGGRLQVCKRAAKGPTARMAFAELASEAGPSAFGSSSAVTSWVVYWAYIGIMEKKMETTIYNGIIWGLYD